MVMPYHLHMPSYFLETFTEYPYILDGKPIEGVIRFFAGYAGWDHGQLAKEIKENSWLIGKAGKETLLNQHFRDLWHTSLNEMGGKYAIWARYPQYPSLN